MYTIITYGKLYLNGSPIPVYGKTGEIKGLDKKAVKDYLIAYSENYHPERDSCEVVNRKGKRVPVEFFLED